VNAAMKTHVEFRSDSFPACDDEGCEINPGRYGKRVAEYLAAGLHSHGFRTKELISEDWGWVIPIENDNFSLWIGCSNYEEYPDGFLCFIEPHTPFIRKLFRKVDTQPRVEALQKAMDALLSEGAGVRDKKWWTHDEFNRGTEEG
jgi:hypothetical protein